MGKMVIRVRLSRNTLTDSELNQKKGLFRDFSG